MNESTEEFEDYSRTASACLMVPAAAGGRRLDQVLAELMPEYSRNRLQSWIRDGRVSVDGSHQREPKHKLFGGERISVDQMADPEQLSVLPEPIALDVVYEDDALIVINKPAGLVVHPGSGNWSGTLMNGLLHRYPGIGQIPRAGIVHRLDKETSGLLVVARTLSAQTDLVRQLQARTVKRQYLAVATGELSRHGCVTEAIGRHPVHRTRMAVVSEERGGKPAITHFRVIEALVGATLVECTLETGRTHQIRVHMASLGHALVGDPVYGRPHSRAPAFRRQALHAQRLGLIHPVTKLALQWEAPVPADMDQLIRMLRHE